MKWEHFQEDAVANKGYLVLEKVLWNTAILSLSFSLYESVVHYVILGAILPEFALFKMEFKKIGDRS